MGQFRIEINGVGGHGCERKAVAGDKLFNRCSKLNCVDCLAFDFVQNLRQKGFSVGNATFTHHVGAVRPEDIIIDDLLKNERRSGQF